MEAQVKKHLTHDVGGERLIAKGPYVYLNQPFEQGPSVKALTAEPGLGLHQALAGVFPYDSVHKHQELALRSVKAGRHTVVATGTGSGKTEAFLLPIIDHCLRLRDQAAAPGVVAILVYPMNALADDQLRRLRPMLAGTGITFGRYTGMTPPEDKAPQGQLESSRAYNKEEQDNLKNGNQKLVPIPHEECYSREDIRTRRPRILISNYSQLEYLLLRDKDLNIFRGAPLRFLVFDEVHTYTGAVGSEVACLIRRLRHVAGKKPHEVTCIGTSATVQDSSGKLDGRAATVNFASRLFGVKEDSIDLVVEHYKKAEPLTDDIYTPPVPAHIRELLAALLEETRKYRLSDSVDDISGELLELTAALCGREADPGSTNMDKAYGLLQNNRLLVKLSRTFTEPMLLSRGLPALRVLDRIQIKDEEMVAEVLCYLALGALVKRNDEPLLRPKLHYFAQGFQGLACSFDEEKNITIFFDLDAPRGESDPMLFPMVLCRSCGQHYVQLISGEEVADGTVGVRKTRIGGRYEQPGDGEDLVYVTNALTSRDEPDEGEKDRATWLCRFCGTLHDRPVVQCHNGKCARKKPIEVFLAIGQMKKCIACGTPAKGYEEIVTPAQSSEVADVTILSQTMLSAMREEALQKLLVFSDNRQDAAFQAGWMDERSKRFRLRHLLFATLQDNPTGPWSFEKLTHRIVEAAQAHGILKIKVFDPEDNEKRVRWFLLQEFASMGQRRNSLESLGLAEVIVHGMSPADAPNFYDEWSGRFGITTEELEALVRTIVDYYRRHGIVSDPLLCHQWTYRDTDVRKGLVQVGDRFFPQAIAIEKEDKSAYLKGWIAGNGASAAQEIVRKGVPAGAQYAPHARNEFLRQLWKVLTRNRVLVPTRLTRKRGSKLQEMQLPGRPFQFDVEKLALRLPDTRYACSACRRAQAVPLPSGNCPEYQCKGTLAVADKDPENFDVYQYTKTRFVPLKAAEHSAQVPGQQRRDIEWEFKKETGGKFNCLVCTPTLELGVDIGKLEMTLMRNVPPTPANYAQRSGRAGRRHRIAVVFTYSRNSNHDRYFFADPRAMIAGEIRVPAFSMRNEPLIRKHVHSAILTSLREQVAEEEKETLDQAFPIFIHAYFADEFRRDDGKMGRRWLKQSRDLSPVADLCKKYHSGILADLHATFRETWPESEEVEELLGAGVLEEYVDGFVEDLDAHVRKLFNQVSTYRKEASALRTKSEEYELDDEDRTRLRRFESAVRALGDRNRLENYALGYLATDGFFPGYAMARQSVSCQSLEPFLEITRPSSVALRELTPANFVYANRNVFRVRKLDFSQAAVRDRQDTAATLQRALYFDKTTERIVDADESQVTGGLTSDAIKLTSIQLVNVEMQRQQEINDSEKARRRIAFEIHGQPLDQHGGGQHGKIGNVQWRYLSRQALRLVNFGVRRSKSLPFSLFPICTRCGEARSPNASEGEIDIFRENHEKLHGSATVADLALHVEFQSDTLHFGPFENREKAVNLFEALRIGARHVLDMGDCELEGFLYRSATGEHWVAMYDPMPGGSGFLPLLLEYWESICEKAKEALEKCASQCIKACYSCLKHFRNQQFHDELDRNVAIDLMMELDQPLQTDHPIPAVTLQPKVDPTLPDSKAEEDFATLCRKRSFPVPPTGQHHIDLVGGGHTLADWAYPDKNVLVYIDGMSKKLHGNPEQRKKDLLLRAKLRMMNFHVVVFTAEELGDSEALALKFEELAVYLGSD